MKNILPAVIICAWLAVSMVGCRTDSSPRLSVPVVPDSIKVSQTDTVSFAFTAKGVQIYECQARTNDPTRFEWIFKAPEADLFDQSGQRIGRHYRGPTWVASDGSKIEGTLKGREPSTDPGAIDWFLLDAKKHEGSGVFSGVSRIQRLETVGGKSPAGGCDPASMGKELRVPYTAVYYFYVAKP